MRALSPILRSVILCAAWAAVAPAQDTSKSPRTPKPKVAKADSGDTVTKPKKAPNPRLFRSEAPLEITLTLNVKQIKRDKNADAPWRAASLRYTDADGKAVTVPVRVKTRGIWRLKHCDFPPLRLKVGDKVADGTLFANLDEPKLVSYCRNLDRYEQYVLQEAQLYRIYRQLTDLSHKVRVLRISYADSATGKVEGANQPVLSPRCYAHTRESRSDSRSRQAAADFTPTVEAADVPPAVPAVTTPADFPACRFR